MTLGRRKDSLCLHKLTHMQVEVDSFLQPCQVIPQKKQMLGSCAVLPAPALKWKLLGTVGRSVCRQEHSTPQVKGTTPVLKCLSFFGHLTPP